MSLLFTDGFEWGQNLFPLVDLKWSAKSGTNWSPTGPTSASCISSNQARTGSLSCFLHYRNVSITKSFDSTYATLIAGFAIYPTVASGSSFIKICAFLDGASYQICLRLTSAGELELLRGTAEYTGTQIAITSGFTGWTSGAWHYCEIKVTFHASNGSYQVDWDGNTELSGTGVNTAGTGNAYADGFRIGATDIDGKDGDPYIDDVYICDDSGSSNNDILGQPYVVTVFPDADGNYGEWTPKGGGDSYSEIDENTLDGDTTYIYSTTSGNRDTHSFSDATLPSGTGPLGVVVNAFARNMSSVQRTIRLLARHGSTDAESGSLILTSGYRCHQGIFETNPSTSSSWSGSEINAAEFGVKDQS